MYLHQSLLRWQESKAPTLLQLTKGCKPVYGMYLLCNSTTAQTQDLWVE